MKEEIFNNGSEHDKRRIMIRINNGYVEFFFYDQYLRQKQWIEEETERRFQDGEDELTEDESGNHNFYWFGVDEWVKDKTERQDQNDNWHKHMRRKNWFTLKMEDWINENTN